MIHDILNRFCSATSVGTPNNTTVNVGSQIDAQVVRDLGQGVPVYLVIQVVSAITSGGAATVSFKLSSDDSASLAVDGNQSVHWESAVIPKASLVAGYRLVVPLPPEADVPYEEFLGVQVTENAGQALTGGTIDAHLTLDPPSDVKSYPSFLS